MNIKFLKNSEPNFSENLKGLLDFDSSNSEMIIETTHNILLAVKEKGDEALLEFSKKFDDLDFIAVADKQPAEILSNFRALTVWKAWETLGPQI